MGVGGCEHEQQLRDAGGRHTGVLLQRGLVHPVMGWPFDSVLDYLACLWLVGNVWHTWP